MWLLTICEHVRLIVFVHAVRSIYLLLRLYVYVRLM
jgi:hypothetical protein